MPRGQKSKARAREKRRQVQVEAQELKVAQATAEEKGESPSCSDQASGDAVPSVSTADLPQKSQGVAPATSAGKVMGHRKFGKGAKRQAEEKGNSSRAPSSIKSLQNDVLIKRMKMLIEYMTYMYKIKRPIRKGEMLKLINKRFKEQFPEIFQKAAYCLNVVFGLQLKEDQPNGQSYTVARKLDFHENESRRSILVPPNRGILIPLLSVIYLNDHCAPEEEVWHFLGMLGIYDGVSHIIFGDVKKLITQDLVQEKYLEYQQVVPSDPPRFEFLWGPRAHAKASKKRMMGFLRNVCETNAPYNSSSLEEALKEKETKVEAESEAQGGTKGKGKRKGKEKGEEGPATLPASEI